MCLLAYANCSLRSLSIRQPAWTKETTTTMQNRKRKWNETKWNVQMKWIEMFVHKMIISLAIRLCTLHLVKKRTENKCKICGSVCSFYYSSFSFSYAPSRHVVPMTVVQTYDTHVTRESERNASRNRKLRVKFQLQIETIGIFSQQNGRFRFFFISNQLRSNVRTSAQIKYANDLLI